MESSTKKIARTFVYSDKLGFREPTMAIRSLRCLPRLGVRTAPQPRFWSAKSEAAGLKSDRPALQVFGVGRSLLVVAALAGVLALPPQLCAQEIPLERCDALPVIDVLVAGQHVRLLVDTAATSMLNLKSFTTGRAKDIRVTSWSGTLATSAKEITLGEVLIGSTKLIGGRAGGETCGGDARGDAELSGGV